MAVPGDAHLSHDPGQLFDTNDPLTIGATAAIYPLIGVMLWTGLRGEGRALHDRVAGTRVRSVEDAERIARLQSREVPT